MTHQHEQLHDGTATTPAVTTDSELAPGRGSRTAGLVGPTGPRPSGLLMRKAERDGNNVAADADTAVGAAASSTGSALPDDLRSRFEGSLGTDLSSVRVHTGAASADAASAVGAKAYTLGNDIHFGAGHFDTASLQGQHLLAHEVAHTVQQRGGSPTRQNKLEVSSPGDAFEHEADHAASAMVSGASFSVGGSPGVVSREGGGPEVSGGISVSKHAVKATAKAEVTKDFPLGYVKISGGGEFAVDGTLQDKVGKDGAKKDAAAGTNLEAQRAEAESGASTALKTQVEAGLEEQELLEADWESPEVEGTTGGGGVSITLNLKIGGKVFPVKFTAAELASGKVNFLSCEVDVPIKLKEATLWENATAKFVAAATVTAKVKVEPNWAKILPKVVEEAATKLRPFLSEILAAVSGEAIIAGGFVAIGVSVLGALVIGAEELAEIDGVCARAHAALARYGDGYSTALGVGRNTSASKLCFGEGQADATTALASQVAAIQNNAILKPFNFAYDEILPALLHAAAPLVPDLTKKAVAQAQSHIFARFARQFYDKEMASTFGSYSNAAAVAARLGVPDAIPARKE